MLGSGSAVSIDEAWGESGLESPPAPPAPPSCGSHSSSARRSRHHDDEDVHDRSHHRSHEDSRRRRRSSRRAYSGDDAEPRSSTEVLSSLVLELRALQDGFAEQQRNQRTAMCVAVGVIMLLLVFVAHSYSRLQYATDCLVHYRGRGV